MTGGDFRNTKKKKKKKRSNKKTNKDSPTKTEKNNVTIKTLKPQLNCQQIQEKH